jgi:hypothetical protein
MARIAVNARPENEARQEASSAYRPMGSSAMQSTPATPAPADVDPDAEIRQKYFSGLEELVDLHRDVGVLNTRVADRKAAMKELEGRIVGLETTIASLVPLPMPSRPQQRPLSVAAVTPPAPARETRSEIVSAPPKTRANPIQRAPAETPKASSDAGSVRKPVKEFKVPKRPVEIPPVKSEHYRSAMNYSLIIS